MYIIAIGIIVAVLLFKIYPSKSKNDLKKRTVQTVFMFALIIALIVAFRFSFFMMKLVIGAILGIIGLYFAFRRRKKQFDNVMNVATTLEKFSSDKNDISRKKS